MTRAEAIEIGRMRPVAFIKGDGGVGGYWGRIFFRDEIREVRKLGQWAFDTRAQAERATKNRMRIMQREAALVAA